ncbi:MAG TPA: hypothetical protein VNF27_12650 [Candidatus Binataceae bacterium]|nr:hypothetical protein [Candidatus Binataceae bacterium]
MPLKAFLILGTLGAFMSVGIAWSVLRVEYPTFLLVTRAVDFLPIHQLQESRIREVIPISLINLVATPAIYWFAPADQRVCAGAAMLGLIVVLVWTIGVQVPAHLALDRNGFDRNSLMRLVRNERIRFLAISVQALGYCALLLTNL